MSNQIVVLEAVYDNSDIMTDYFAKDTPYTSWYVSEYPGKAVTEAKMRATLQRFPGWLQQYEWQWQRGENYSMSDHPRGQLRADGQTGILVYAGSSNSGREIGFLLSTTSESIFLMNNRKEAPIPATLDEFKALIVRKEEERLANREGALRKVGTNIVDAAANAGFVRPSQAQPADNTPGELRAIFDGMSESEKVGVAFGMFPARLQDLTHNDVVGLMKLREEVGPRMTFDDEQRKR
ncbi:MAG: hypothetical protein ACLP9K_04990 [Nitrososphaerales archaeon]